MAPGYSTRNWRGIEMVVKALQLFCQPAKRTNERTMLWVDTFFFFFLFSWVDTFFLFSFSAELMEGGISSPESRRPERGINGLIEMCEDHQGLERGGVCVNFCGDKELGLALVIGEPPE